MKTLLELFESEVREACVWEHESERFGIGGPNPHKGTLQQLREKLENLLPIPEDGSEGAEDLRPLLLRRVEALEERFEEVKEVHDAMIEFANEQSRLASTFNMKVM